MFAHGICRPYLLAEQEAAYREVWLDPLQRRIKGRNK
jgi:hypothetical protein